MVNLPEKFLNTISFGMSDEDEHRIKRVRLGEGWSARVTDGMNSLETQLSISWDNLTIAEAVELKGFWNARRGVESVQLTPPDYEEPISVIMVGKFSRRYVAYNLRSCSIDVERVYDNA